MIDFYFFFFRAYHKPRLVPNGSLNRDHPGLSRTKRPTAFVIIELSSSRSIRDKSELCRVLLAKSRDWTWNLCKLKRWAAFQGCDWSNRIKIKSSVASIPWGASYHPAPRFFSLLAECTSKCGSVNFFLSSTPWFHLSLSTTKNGWSFMSTHHLSAITTSSRRSTHKILSIGLLIWRTSCANRLRKETVLCWKRISQFFQLFARASMEKKLKAKKKKLFRWAWLGRKKEKRQTSRDCGAGG